MSHIVGATRYRINHIYLGFKAIQAFNYPRELTSKTQQKWLDVIFSNKEPRWMPDDMEVCVAGDDLAP